MLLMHNFLEITLYQHCQTCCFRQISWITNTDSSSKATQKEKKIIN